MKVWILTTGDGMEGDEWMLHGVYSSLEACEKAIQDAKANLIASISAGERPYMLAFNKPKEVEMDATPTPLFNWGDL